MKLNDFVKAINKQDFLWCKHRNIYGVVYDKCLLVFLENADSLNTRKQFKQTRNSKVLNETQEIQAINIKELTPAVRTGDILYEKDRVLERFSSDSMDMWFNQDLLRWFSPSVQYFFSRTAGIRSSFTLLKRIKSLLCC